MNNALAHKNELEATIANYDQSIAEIRNDVIHSILHVALRITEHGKPVHIHLCDGYIYVIYFDNNNVCQYINGLGNHFLKTPEQLIDALRQLEELENAAFIKDTLSTFKKDEVTNDAETV